MSFKRALQEMVFKIDVYTFILTKISLLRRATTLLLASAPQPVQKRIEFGGLFGGEVLNIVVDALFHGDGSALEQFQAARSDLYIHPAAVIARFGAQHQAFLYEFFY